MRCFSSSWSFFHSSSVTTNDLCIHPEVSPLLKCIQSPLASFSTMYVPLGSTALTGCCFPGPLLTFAWTLTTIAIKFEEVGSNFINLSLAIAKNFEAPSKLVTSLRELNSISPFLSAPKIPAATRISRAPTVNNALEARRGRRRPDQSTRLREYCCPELSAPFRFP